MSLDSALGANADTISQYERDITDPRQHFLKILFYSVIDTLSRRNSKPIQYNEAYGPYTFALAMIVIAFSLLDTCFTLVLIQHGAYESNPIMNFFLEQGNMVFFAVKYVTTILAVIILLKYLDYYILNIIKGSQILAVSAVIYVGLINYQLTMLDELVFRRF